MQGEYCRIWDGSKPLILEPKSDPYIFHSPIIRPATVELDGYDAFVNQSELVIQHAVHHIITVPSGSVRRGNGTGRIAKLSPFSRVLCCFRLRSRPVPIPCGW